MINNILLRHIVDIVLIEDDSTEHSYRVPTAVIPGSSRYFITPYESLTNLANVRYKGVTLPIIDTFNIENKGLLIECDPE